MIHLVRFDSMLDAYVRRVFNRVGGEFSRNSVGDYVCGSGAFGSGAFGEGLAKFVLESARPGVVFPAEHSFDCSFVVGDCCPADNILLELGAPLPGSGAKYALVEKDIKIDGLAFNSQADEAFNRIFRAVPPGAGGVFAVRHRRLGAGTLVRLLKRVFGEVNCAEEDFRFAPGARCVECANDVIEAAAPRKSRLNRMPETRVIMDSVRQYVGECTGADWSCA